MNAEHLRELREKAGIVTYDVQTVRVCHLIALLAERDRLLGALQFILAFYEPGQTYLDTNAWKRAEEGARDAVAKANGS